MSIEKIHAEIRLIRDVAETAAADVPRTGALLLDVVGRLEALCVAEDFFEHTRAQVLAVKSDPPHKTFVPELYIGADDLWRASYGNVQGVGTSPNKAIDNFNERFNADLPVREEKPSEPYDNRHELLCNLRGKELSKAGLGQFGIKRKFIESDFNYMWRILRETKPCEKFRI